MDPLHNIPRLSELSEHLLRLSVADRTSLSALSSVSDIQKWTTAKVDEYRQFSLALLAIHNLAAPIHRLPTEVLERILSHCWQDRASLRLLRVCSLWRSIIRGRAAFWAEAATKCGPLFDKRPVMHDDLSFVDAVLSRGACHSDGIAPFFHGFSTNIVRSLTPYIGNVVSLRVTLDKPWDLYGGLWPVLRAGMPKLNTLHIDLVEIPDTNDEGDVEWDFDDEDEDSPLGHLSVLSHANLPQLSRLICHPIMVRFFAGIPIRYMTVATGRDDPSELSDTEIMAPWRYLELYRHCLEKLEITGPGDILWDEARPAAMQAIQLSSLRDLRVMSLGFLNAAILSWLAFPHTTHIHIANAEIPHGPPFQQLFERADCVALRRAVTTADRVYIRWPSRRKENHTLLCFTSNVERLRLENYLITRQGLLEVFRTNPSVTHLSLSFGGNRIPLDGEVDLHAFPHLVRLDMNGPDLDMDILACMLRPTEKQRNPRRPSSPKPPLCTSLTDLVITCGLTVQARAATARPTPPKSKPKGPSQTLPSTSKTDNNPGPGPSTPQSWATVADETFKRKWSSLQQVLAHRASSGYRLSSLTLRLHAATWEILGQAAGDPGFDVEAYPIWPSATARQSVLESLERLVDGPVVLKLLDGSTVDVDEEAVV